jgi:hypothetical protein
MVVGLATKLLALSLSVKTLLHLSTSTVGLQLVEVDTI